MAQPVMAVVGGRLLCRKPVVGVSYQATWRGCVRREGGWVGEGASSSLLTMHGKRTFRFID